MQQLQEQMSLISQTQAALLEKLGVQNESSVSTGNSSAPDRFAEEETSSTVSLASA
jgi:hypothetical protein